MNPMNRIFQIIAIALFSLFYNCTGGDCEQLPANYSSYAEAIQTIQSAHFKIAESINTSKSSWIRGASYYSCDGNTGFFIIKTDRGDYIHSNMPIDIWEEFKNAKSYGSYYNQFIKHRYYFTPN